MEVTCFNKKEVVCTKKTGNLVAVDIVEDMEIAEVTLERVHNIFLQ